MTRRGARLTGRRLGEQKETAGRQSPNRKASVRGSIGGACGLNVFSALLERHAQHRDPRVGNRFAVFVRDSTRDRRLRDQREVNARDLLARIEFE
jgi:hypothetical protein